LKAFTQAIRLCYSKVLAILSSPTSRKGLICKMGRGLWQTFDLKESIKLSLCTAWSRMCGWNYSSTHPWPHQQRRVSGQFQNPGHFPFPSGKWIPGATE